MAIPKIYKYGIEITKPWSKAMYDFNDNIRTYYQDQILDLIETLDTPERCQAIAKVVNPYGYGPGLEDDVEYMQDDMRGNIQNAANYWIKECVDDLIKMEEIEPMICEVTPEMSWLVLYDAGEVMNLIGFESREEILALRKRYTPDEAPF
jgi:hypothetical protein